MRVTIDLERDIIIIPDNFFPKIKADNERLERYGATPISGLDRIKKSFEIAMADTDNRLVTQSNAKTTTRSKKAITPEDAKKMLEAEASAEKATENK